MSQHTGSDDQAPVRWSGVFASVGVALAALGAVGIGYWYFLAPGENPEQFPTASKSAPHSVKNDVASDDVVRRYLDALGAGDIESAAGLGNPGDGDPILLSNAQNMRQRPHGFRIDDVSGEGNIFQVSYTLSGEPVDAAFEVEDVAGERRLKNSASTIVVDLPNGNGLPVVVNGVEVPIGVALAVVPGVYEFSTGLKTIDFPSSESFRVNAPDDQTVLVSPAPQLTPLGSEALRASVRRSLDECFASKTAATEHCPQSLVPEGKLVEGSVEWRLRGNPLNDAQVRLADTDLTCGEVPLTIRYSVRYRVEGNDAWITQDHSIDVVASSRVLSEQEMTVEWRN